MAPRTKPKNLRQGPWQKCRHEGKGVDVDPGNIEKPADLGPAAAKEWDRIVPKLERYNLISELDETALIQYCELTAEFKMQPVLFTAAKHTQLRMVMGDLGLTPMSRAKLPTPKDQGKAGNPFNNATRKRKGKAG